MSRNRLEAFSDGVIAILITIMVLELTIPHHDRLADLWDLRYVFLSYVLSFVYLAIYWNNHHHVLYLTDRVTGGVLWANINLLFWLSLVPFGTAWMGENGFTSTPTAVYGFILLMAAIAYYVLERVIIRSQGPESLLAQAVGSDRKGQVSLVLYLCGDPASRSSPRGRRWSSSGSSRRSGWCRTGASRPSSWRARTGAGRRGGGRTSASAAPRGSSAPREPAPAALLQGEPDSGRWHCRRSRPWP